MLSLSRARAEPALACPGAYASHSIEGVGSAAALPLGKKGNGDVREDGIVWRRPAHTCAERPPSPRLPPQSSPLGHVIGDGRGWTDQFRCVRPALWLSQIGAALQSRCLPGSLFQPATSSGRAPQLLPPASSRRATAAAAVAARKARHRPFLSEPAGCLVLGNAGRRWPAGAGCSSGRITCFYGRGDAGAHGHGRADGRWDTQYQACADGLPVAVSRRRPWSANAGAVPPVAIDWVWGLCAVQRHSQHAH